MDYVGEGKVLESDALGIPCLTLMNCYGPGSSEKEPIVLLMKNG